MSRHTIRQGNHYDNRLFSSWPHVGKTSMQRHVRFHESCRYRLPEYNALDINKLFGLSFGFFALHENSARVGWYYDGSDDRIVLVAYCYVNGQRNWDAQLRFPEIVRVKIGEEAWLSIEHHFSPAVQQYAFTFQADADHSPWKEVVVPTVNLPEYGFTHSVYFGGVLPAPHTMHLEISKHSLP